MKKAMSLVLVLIMIPGLFAAAQAEETVESTLLESIYAQADEMYDELVEIRRDFHKYAEPGWLEMRTTSLIARRLSDLGYTVLVGRDVCNDESRMGLPDEDEFEAHYTWAEENGADPTFLPATRDGFTGVIATLDCGEGPTVALRFDIDALGVAECADVDHKPAADGYASVVEGVMHACGHDGHTAIGLGVAKLLMDNRDHLHGKVKLIFQPAEEGVRGAKSIVDAGHLDDVDYVIAAHIFPGNETEGFDLAMVEEGGSGGLATSKFDITFQGKSAHAGISPHTGNNAMLAAATAVLNIHAMPRYGDTPTQINVGKLTAGSGRNVVCENATLEIEVRGQTSEANEYMEAYALRIAESAALMHGCTYEVTRMGSAAAMNCTWALYERIADICEENLSLHTLVVSEFGGSEDFSCMSERVLQNGGQAAYVGLLTDCPAANHNDHFDFDERVLVNGVKVFMSITLDILTL